MQGIPDGGARERTHRNGHPLEDPNEMIPLVVLIEVKIAR
jgi:hypothetical protein